MSDFGARASRTRLHSQASHPPASAPSGTDVPHGTTHPHHLTEAHGAMPPHVTALTCVPICCGFWLRTSGRHNRSSFEAWRPQYVRPPQACQSRPNNRQCQHQKNRQCQPTSAAHGHCCTWIDAATKSVDTFFFALSSAVRSHRTACGTGRWGVCVGEAPSDFATKKKPRINRQSHQVTRINTQRKDDVSACSRWAPEQGSSVWAASKVVAVIASPSLLCKCSSSPSVCICSSLLQVLVLVPVRLSLCLALLRMCVVLFLLLLWWQWLRLRLFFPLASVVSRLVGVTLVVVRYLLRVRVFGRILSSTRSPLFFSVPLQSPLSSRGAVSLCLMLLSLALCVPRFARSHPLLFMPVFLCRPLKLLPRLLMNVAFNKTRAEYVERCQRRCCWVVRVGFVAVPNWIVLTKGSSPFHADTAWSSACCLSMAENRNAETTFFWVSEDIKPWNSKGFCNFPNLSQRRLRYVFLSNVFCVLVLCIH